MTLLIPIVRNVKLCHADRLEEESANAPAPQNVPSPPGRLSAMDDAAVLGKILHKMVYSGILLIPALLLLDGSFQCFLTRGGSRWCWVSRCFCCFDRSTDERGIVPTRRGKKYR